MCYVFTSSFAWLEIVFDNGVCVISSEGSEAESEVDEGARLSTDDEEFDPRTAKQRES